MHISGDHTTEQTEHSEEHHKSRGHCNKTLTWPTWALPHSLRYRIWDIDRDMIMKRISISLALVSEQIFKRNTVCNTKITSIAKGGWNCQRETQPSSPPVPPQRHKPSWDLTKIVHLLRRLSAVMMLWQQYFNARHARSRRACSSAIARLQTLTPGTSPRRM